MCEARPEGFHDPQKNYNSPPNDSSIADFSCRPRFFVSEYVIFIATTIFTDNRSQRWSWSELSDTAPIIMALRLKKDVQKASYYVWFLGAQESKELRGERVLVSTIPRLIDRSRHQEPLKVTLQISHKGLKIIQVSCRLPNPRATCQLPNIPQRAAQFQSLSIFALLYFIFCLNTYPRCDFNIDSKKIEKIF